MRNNHDHLGSLGTNLVHHLLHVVVLNAKGPVGHKVARVRNGGVREGLANNRHRNTVLLTNHIGLEDWVAKVVCLHILRKKFNFPCELLLNNLHDAIGPVGELPVGTHHVNA